MNKYLLEVEAIQFTEDNAKEVRELVDRLCTGLNDEDRFLSDVQYVTSSMVYFYDIDIDVGEWLIVTNNRLIAVLNEDEFEKIAKKTTISKLLFWRIFKRNWRICHECFYEHNPSNNKGCYKCYKYSEFIRGKGER